MASSVLRLSSSMLNSGSIFLIYRASIVNKCSIPWLVEACISICDNCKVFTVHLSKCIEASFTSPYTKCGHVFQGLDTQRSCRGTFYLKIFLFHDSKLEAALPMILQVLNPETKIFLVLQKVIFSGWWLLKINVLLTRVPECRK